MATTTDAEFTGTVSPEILQIARQMDRDASRDAGVRTFPFAVVSVSDGTRAQHSRLFRQGLSALGPVSVAMLLVGAGIRGLS